MFHLPFVPNPIPVWYFQATGQGQNWPENPRRSRWAGHQERSSFWCPCQQAVTDHIPE